jgi:tetratricopeptide (TPR) repeat protein
MLNTVTASVYKHAFNFFGDPALNIMAQGFEVTHDIDLPDTTTISTKITVRNGATVTIPYDGELRFENSGKLIIEDGATLRILDNDTLRAISGNDSLLVYGNLQIGDNVRFMTENDASFVINFRNQVLSVTMNETHFDNITFTAYVDTLFVLNSTFNNSSVELKRASDNYYSLSSSKFYNTYVKADVEQKISEAGQITIADCQFHNSTTDSTILIDRYPNFIIHDDSLIYAHGDGIDIYNSGSSVGLMQNVYNCYILDSVNAVLDPSSGIKIYHSYISIRNNLITNNIYGISCLDRSNIYLEGNQSAQTPDETQQIVNNIHNQVFIIEGSFPNNFHWNVIYNSDVYHHDTLVTLHTRHVGSTPNYNVENNYWGDNFDPYHDLHPTILYDWTPVWTPPWIIPKSTSEDEALFEGAEQAIIDGDYAGAESNFKEIIENYPESEYLQASVKELLALKRIYDHDFTGLENYLDTVSTLQQDTATMNLTAHVANWCNIENEDYSTAINWFEGQIENPPSFEDSIFAIIDLGYTYTLMESGENRSSTYIGRYPEYKPVSSQAYEKNRDYLINLLFKSYGNQQQDQTTVKNDITTFNLVQNFPNPFRESTDIVFRIPEAARVSIKVYNVLGALMATPYDEQVESGEHKFTFTPKNFSEGIYYYSLEVNNEQKDMKKMILLK